MNAHVRKILLGIKRELYAHNKAAYIKEKISSQHPEICINLEPYDSLEGLNADILLTDSISLTKELENLPKSVKWIQLSWAGVNEMVKEVNGNEKYKSVFENITITRLGGVLGREMTEYVIGSIISMERGFFHLREDQKKKVWRNPESNKFIYRHRLFTQLSIGILGVGDIGFCIAKALKDLGMTVYGLCTTPKDLDVISECYTIDMLPDMLSKCDYICNVLPSTSKTVGLLSNGLLEHCKEKCPSFINVGRGTIISEEDLLIALSKQWISSAFLDVFNEEPLPKESLLWDTDNVYITPHVSGILEFYEETIVENLLKYIKNQPLNYVVDFNKEY